MCFPTPTSVLLLLHHPPATRPVHDIPPVIRSSPRRPRLRRLVGYVTPGRPGTPGLRVTDPVGLHPTRSLAWLAAEHRVSSPPVGRDRPTAPSVRRAARHPSAVKLHYLRGPVGGPDRLPLLRARRDALIEEIRAQQNALAIVEANIATYEEMA